MLRAALNLIVLLFCSLSANILFAQDTPDTAKHIIIPQLYYTNIENKATKLQARLTKQSKKALRKLEVQEAKIWLTATTYYDVNGRPLQTISTNHKGGTDLATTQYSFTGKVLSTLSKHNNPAATLAGTQTTTIQQTTLYQNNYAVSTRQRIVPPSVGGGGDWHPISTLQYDDMGKAIHKQLGNGYTMDGLAETFYTHFSYNIRGWLTGINKSDYQSLSPIFGSEFYKPIFSQTLSYDYGFTVATLGSGYYNGNISGIQWAHAGDKMKRAFGYEYDAANRLTQAHFNQNENGTWTNATINYSTQNSYDANGNILTMQQWGLKLGSSDVIDQLAYTYLPNSNKLLKVVDTHDDPDFKLSDFKDGTNGTNNDYAYDQNGNMREDKNKNIVPPPAGGGGIVYNYLNLPQTITVANKGTISYTYDAAGNKLQKLVTPTTGAATTTDYLDAFQYQNNQLQQVAHAEGRVRYVLQHFVDQPQAQYGWQYDFYYKDHLGNIRETVTEQVDTSRYKATMEVENNVSQLEELIYNNLQPTRRNIYNIIGYPNTTLLTPVNQDQDNKYTAQVNGNINNGTGPATVLKVMAGDRFDVACISWYKENGPPQNPQGNGLSQVLLNQLTQMISGSVGSLSGGKASATQLANGPGLPGGIGNFLNNQGDDYSNNPQKPKAYLNYILFDEQFNMVQAASGYDPVGQADELKTHALLNLPITKSGYLYVYVSNETTNTPVYFDNLTVLHRTGPLLQEDDYYPFGLEMKMLGSRASGKQENKLGITSKEKQDNEFADGTGLEWYDFGARMQDPQIGRWHAIDPKASDYAPISPYAYVANNPISYIDPNGMEIGVDGGTDEERKAFLAFIASAFGGSKNVNVSYNKNRSLNNISINKGAKLSDEQKAGVAYINGVIGSDVKAVFSILGNDPDGKALNLGFSFIELTGKTEVDMSDLGNYTKYRDPLNVLIHETEEQFQSKNLGTKDYDVVHPLANAKEFEITGKRESNMRDNYDAIKGLGNPKGSMVPVLGLTTRFDYVGRTGNYVETRQGTAQGGRLRNPSTFDNRTPTEEVKEQKFKTSTLEGKQ